MDNKWYVTAFISGLPIPIYILLPLIPLDVDLMEVATSERLIFGVAGLYALSEVFTDIRQLAGRAHERKDRKRGEDPGRG